MSWRVLPDQLDEVAARWPTHGLAVVDRRQSVRYPELAHRVRRAALALARAGLRPGDNVGLLLPTCVEFYVALLGAMRAGLAPSPFAPPASAQRVASDVRGFRRALANGRCRALVIDAQTAGRLGAAVDDLGVPVLAIEALDGEPPADAPPATLPVIDPARDLALIQYTSGSTSHPKGVALTHDQLAAGVQAIARGIALTAADVNGQWLPIHHDMGLIGSLTGLSVGVDQFLWSPMSFVRDPLRWLAGFAARRATIYAGPNFSYAELAARADDADLAGLDLSAWRVAFNGAEPVDAGVLRRFGARFARAGLRADVVMPVYGLAEVTLAATFPPLGQAWHAARVRADALGAGATVEPAPADAAAARDVVAVGAPVAGHAVRIVHDGAELGDDRVGEIWLRGPAVMTGYYRDDAATGEALVDGWLRTGDLGFVRGGELYVTGRLKEMMILHGRNYYPHDVEDLVSELPGCHRGVAVAFTGEDAGGEHMIVVAETRLADPGACAALAAASQRAVAAALAIPRLEVVLVRPGAVPRTTSGKRQRLLVKASLGQPGFAASVIWSTRARVASEGASP